MRSCSESGQATVEAAFLLPVLFVVFGLFLQPTILLYNRSVMSAAASESCRLVATNTMSDAAVKAYVVRRLGGVPHLGIFHVGGDKTWDISWEGPDEKGEVSVSIANRAQPLPLFGVVAGLGNNINENGEVEQRVEAKSSCVPKWAAKAGSADEWMAKWKSSGEKKSAGKEKGKKKKSKDSKKAGSSSKETPS